MARAAGGHGVDLFFVLSGYLITSISLREERTTGKLSLAAFYLRRTFRIFPLYYLVLGAYCFLIFATGISPEKRPGLAAALPYYLTYMQEIFLNRDLNGASIPFYQSWSLGVEEKFYLVWPVLIFLVLRRWPRWRIPATILMILISRFSVDVLASYHHILAGCLLAFLLEVPAIRRAFTGAGAAGAWISLAALVLVHGFVAERLVYSLVAAWFVGSILVTRTLLNAVLANSVLAWLGRMSYGFYLVHILCLNVAERLAHSQPVLSLIFATAISAGVAYLLHISVEVPLIAIGRRLARRATAAPAAQVAARSLRE